MLKNKDSVIYQQYKKAMIVHNNNIIYQKYFGSCHINNNNYYISGVPLLKRKSVS